MKRQIKMMPRKIINLICVIFCLGVFLADKGLSSAFGDEKRKDSDIEAKAGIDRLLVRIGDKITYTITVEAKKNIEVEFPQILPENLAGFAVKDFGSSQKGVFGKKIFKQWYLLDTYVSGEHVIPAAFVKYRLKGEPSWRELHVNEVKLEIKSVLDTSPEKTDIRDIIGPKSFADKMRLYVLTALAAFLIAGAFFSFIFWKKKNKEFKLPPVPAHIIAYEALAALEKKDYIRQQQAKIYYIELSDIVRHYLENRFNIRAPEMTTEEFLVKVREDSALSLEHKSLLRDFLTNCDLVKFAKYQPVEPEASLSFSSAKKLVDQTKEEVSA